MEDLTKKVEESAPESVNVIGENPTESNVSGMTQDMGSALNLWLAAAHNLYRSLQIFSNGSNGGMRQSNVGNNLVDRNNEPSAKQVSERRYACDQCPKMYSFHSNLYRHKREAHHENNVNNQKRCPREYVRLTYFKEHIKECKAKKDGVKQTKKCPFCDREFFSNSGFYSHQKKHTAPAGSSDLN